MASAPTGANPLEALHQLIVAIRQQREVTYATGKVLFLVQSGDTDNGPLYSRRSFVGWLGDCINLSSGGEFVCYH
jgi:hypothetical protein